MDPALNHEALHTVMVVTNLFDREVSKHPAIDGNTKLKQLAVEIEEKLGNLYQEIGKL